MVVKSVLVIVSANAEWQIVTSYYPDCRLQESVFNSWFELPISGNKIIFYHGGWGKISAAATAQYAIDRWKPDLMVNLGTCGGMAGRVQAGEVVLATETIVYDICERMGDAQAAIDYYTTRLDLSWLTEPLPMEVRRTRLISADRDIDPREIRPLMEQFQTCAADWESGAIAWVAARNQLPCLILRGVTDVVDECDGEVYGNFGLFTDRTRGIMTRLLETLPAWLASLQ